MERQQYVDYIVEETKKILAIDSPSGFTKEAAEYVMQAYRSLGYEPELTVKGGVFVKIRWQRRKKCGAGGSAY